MKEQRKAPAGAFFQINVKNNGYSDYCVENNCINKEHI